MEPTVIEYQELKQITDGFSENRKIGEGGYGKVYWVRLQTCLLNFYPGDQATAVYCKCEQYVHFKYIIHLPLK